MVLFVLFVFRLVGRVGLVRADSDGPGSGMGYESGLNNANVNYTPGFDSPSTHCDDDVKQLKPVAYTYCWLSPDNESH